MQKHHSANQNKRMIINKMVSLQRRQERDNNRNCQRLSQMALEKEKDMKTKRNVIFNRWFS